MLATLRSAPLSKTILLNARSQYSKTTAYVNQLKLACIAVFGSVIQCVKLLELIPPQSTVFTSSTGQKPESHRNVRHVTNAVFSKV